MSIPVDDDLCERCEQRECEGAGPNESWCEECAFDHAQVKADLLHDMMKEGVA